MPDKNFKNSTIEFKSIDKASRTIEGYASTNDLDTYRDVVLPTAFEKNLPRFMKNPILCFMHNWDEPIGKILEAKITDKGLWVKAWISETAPKVWIMIEEGILKAFSFAWDWEDPKTDYSYDEVKDIRYIKNLILLEVSVVSIPANGEALFEQIKSKGFELDHCRNCKDGKQGIDCLLCKDSGLSREIPLANINVKTQTMEVSMENVFAPEDKKNLDGAIQTLSEVKTALEGKVDKNEIESITQKAAQDAVDAVKILQKERRRIEYIAELEGQPGFSNPMNAPEVVLAKSPKEKFAKMLTVSTKDNRVRGLQQAGDDLLLTHILMKKYGQEYQGIKSLRMYERWNQVSSEFRKALDTQTSGDGADWIPTGFSAALIDKYRLALKVAALFQTIQMPTNPYKYPLLTADMDTYFVPEALQDIDTKINASQFTTSGLTFTAKKHATRILCSDELTEDSVVAVLPIMQAQMAKAMASGVEDVLINGDNTATHMDTDTALLASTNRRKMLKGLRRLIKDCDDTSSTALFDASTWESAAMRSVRALMGKYGVNPSELAWITCISAYLKMLSFTNFATVDKFGPAATWLQGFLSAVDGIPIVVSEWARQDLSANGYNVSSNTYNAAMLVNKGAYMIGERRSMTVKSKEEIETDQEILVVTQRFDFQKIYPTADVTGAVGYKITS